MESGAIHSGDVTVVICAYTHDRWLDLCSAITSVVMQRDKPYELLVVTDHNDALADDVARFAARIDPDVPVRVLASRGPRGLSGARNSGVAAAVTPIVAFLDDDATADPHWIARMVERYDGVDVRGVGGYARPTWPGGRRPPWFPAEFDWVVGCSYPGQPTGVATVRNFIGANMSLRRDDIIAAGGFHTGLGRVGRIPLGCEETELCIGIAQRHPAARLVFDPAMMVNHRVTEDRITPRYFIRRCYAEGVSKAAVSRLVGSGDGLSSEREYVTRVLPLGIATRVRGSVGGVAEHRAVADGARSRLDLITQTGAIVGGALVTAAGYARARLSGTVIAARDGGVSQVEHDEPEIRRSGA